MPITAADLIAPTGELTVELMGALDATVTPAALAQSYLTVAEARVAEWTDVARADRAAAALVYQKAFGLRAQQILNAASQVSAGDVSEGYQSASQAKELQALANRWGALFESEAAEEAAAGVTPEPAPLPPTSRSTPFRVSW